jgi:hypothetical protein
VRTNFSSLFGGHAFEFVSRNLGSPNGESYSDLATGSPILLGTVSRRSFRGEFTALVRIIRVVAPHGFA